MKIAFTLCSLNYLHQAITLGQSLLRHNADYKFIIGLVDIMDERVDATKLPPYEIMHVATVVPSDMLIDMAKRYHIIELNTAAKPFYFTYLFEHYNPEFIIYFDPDICIYQPLTELEQRLIAYNFVLTPHLLAPPPSHLLHERASISTGIFNLGFLGLKNSTVVKTDFLTWWTQYLYKKGHNNLFKHHFYDQLPMNLVPCYYEKVFIERNPGYNIAGWNIYQRTVSLVENKYMINEHFPLIFYHFSGYKINQPNKISIYNQLMAEEGSALETMLHDYKNQLLSNHYQYFKELKCGYKVQPHPTEYGRIKTFVLRFRRFVNNATDKFLFNL
jgi:hypothetical protein